VIVTGRKQIRDCDLSPNANPTITVAHPDKQTDHCVS